LEVAADSPASAAGIHSGDILLAINDVAVPRAAVVANRLYRAGLWTQLRYKLSRNGEEFETRLITTHRTSQSPVENYLPLVGLLYLFMACSSLHGGGTLRAPCIFMFLPGLLCCLFVPL